LKALTKTIFEALCLFKRSSVNTLQPLEQFSPTEVEKILVISCTAIGDTLFATPAIRALRNILPDREIHLLVRQKFLDLFRNNPFTDRVMGYRGGYKGAFRLFCNIKSHGFQLCLIFHDSDPCPVQISFLAGIPFIFRIGQRDELARPYLSARIPYDQRKHAIDQRLEVIRQVFKVALDTEEDLRMDLPINHQLSQMLWLDLLSKAEISDENTKKIGLQFSASGKYKIWPEENFVQLATRLLETSSNNIICLIGSPKERREAQKIKKTMIQNGGEAKRILNLAGAVGLKHFGEMIHGLDLLVTNDTGPLHVAIAVGTPTVSLFVPSNHRATGPVQDLGLHKVITKPRPCRPCTEKYCSTPHCMGLISVDEVFEAVLRGLRAGKS